MTFGKVTVSYRELAERLGTSPDAARMKAKRKAKLGLWRIIPGNHPSDRVMVEIPEHDLNKPERVGGDQFQSVHPEHSTPAHGGEQPNTLVLESLQTAHNRITELTGQLLAEKDEHRQTAIELAQAKARQIGLTAEIDRLEIMTRNLQTELAHERRTWWQKITGT